MLICRNCEPNPDPTERGCDWIQCDDCYRLERAALDRDEERAMTAHDLARAIADALIKEYAS